MQPTLLRLFDNPVPSYFTLLVVGFMFAVAVGGILARQMGENPDVIVDLGIAMLILGVVGARILHVFADGYFWDYVNLCVDPSLVDWRVEQHQCLSRHYDGVWDAAKGVCHPKEKNCFAWANLGGGGFAFYGGLLLAIPGGLWLCKRDGFPRWKAAEVGGLGIALGLVFGRMGCLLAGCCFGQLTHGPLGLSFPAYSPASDSQAKAGLLAKASLESLPVLPTQVMESAACLAIVAFCTIWVLPRKRYHGESFTAFLGLYAVARFALEFFRDDDRGALLWFSTSQWIGVGILVVALLVHRNRLVWARAQAAMVA